MQPKEAIITFETIYEILRREKNKADIQKIDKEFYESIKQYLKEKQELYEKSLVKTDIFSITERPNIALQLHNTKKLIRELYEKREKKIIEMALITSKTKTNIINVENLLEEERKLFGELINILDKYREDFITKAINDAQVEYNSTGRSGTRSTSETPKQELKQQAPPTENAKTEKEPAPKNSMNIEFVEFTEAFFGKELEEYGPYNKGDKAELPCEIAQILINQNKATKTKSF